MVVDITENSCGLLGAHQQQQQRQALTFLDDAIMNIVTMETSAVANLRALIKMDGESGIGHALLALELLRHSVYHETSPHLVDDEIHACLATLERHADKLTLRERYFGAAALAWRRGNYRLAGALLESSLLASPSGDAVALRLAQDCYLAAGDSKNVLGCVTRCLQIMDKQHLLHGHFQGMLAVGYLEVGRLVDAEEAATRAIKRTNGRDVWAVLSLLNVYQLTGRSSEIVATLEEHLEHHEGMGEQSLLFSKGCALAQRGNCRSALRVFDSMLSHLQQHDERSAALLVQATCLFWQISLHEVSHQVVSRWPLLASMWVNVAPGGERRRPAPFMELCKTMALAGYYNTRGSESNGTAAVTRQESIDNADSIELPEGGRILAPRVAGMAGRDASTPAAPTQVRPDPLAWVWQGFQQAISPKKPRSDENAAAAAEKAAAESVAQEKQAALDGRALLVFAQQHMDGLAASAAASPKASSSAELNGSEADAQDALHFPTLRAMQPSFRLVAGSPEMAVYMQQRAGYSERDWAMDTCGASIAQALASFQAGDDGPARAADILTAHQASAARLGGTLAMRDLLSQTLIEATLRSGRWTEARLLLSERITLAPNDAQSWRRQASVLGRLGNQDLAEVAHYTAWQLGIGQGGFGGPR